MTTREETAPSCTHPWIGHCGTHCIDTHDGHVVDPVWDLYARAQELTGRASTLLEWDAKIPEFPVVHAEVLKAKQYFAEKPEGECGVRNSEFGKKSRDESVVLSRGPRLARVAEGSIAATAVSNPIAFLVADVE
jgi:hypothetical protein